jgi:Pyruvate/2-oxoacid:ferredoxin oxidoreductase delta subunit
LVRTKMPWIDRNECDIAEHCDYCKSAEHCPHDAFLVVEGDESREGKCKVVIDFDSCKLCGECAHACIRGAVRMI